MKAPEIGDTAVFHFPIIEINRSNLVVKDLAGYDRTFTMKDVKEFIPKPWIPKHGETIYLFMGRRDGYTFLCHVDSIYCVVQYSNYDPVVVRTASLSRVPLDKTGKPINQEPSSCAD